MTNWDPIRYARNGDVSIAYTVGGDGPIDVLFIGGFVGHLEIFRELPLAERFLDRLASFARIIAFDKRGMGLSDRDAGAYTLENIADDALAVLDAVGVERAAVFGASEGGPAATMLAAAHADRVTAMVQYGTYARLAQAPDYPQGVPVEVMKSFWRRTQETWGDPNSVEAWAPSHRGDPELRDWWGRLVRSGASPSVARTIGLMYEELDVRELLPLVKVPTLVLYRSGDRLVPPALSKTVAEGIPGARDVELAGEDHLFIAGDQGALFDEVEEFLTGHRTAPVADRVLSTVLFTDLVGSTRKAAELGDKRWRELLERHHRQALRELEQHRGVLVKTIGDGLLATFDGPARAVRAALAIRDGAESAGLELRAGVHTGECEVMGSDVAGIAVHIASRIEASADPGGVLVSSTVKDLVVGSGLEFQDQGARSLRDVPGEWRLFTVAGDSEANPGGSDRLPAGARR
jgi:class 3 adenylate cyclase